MKKLITILIGIVILSTLVMAGAPYPAMNGTAAGQDLGYIVAYANTLTDGWLIWFIAISFFLILLLGSMFAQQRFTGRMRWEVSFAAASFSTFGFVVILSSITGLKDTPLLLTSLGVFIISVMFLVLSPD